MIIGHKAQQKKLRLLFEKRQIPHAMLFSGPGNVGKRTIALSFLKMINCEEKRVSCSGCRSCYEIDEKIHPDILEVYPENKEIHVKQIEKAIEKTSYKGIKARHKGVVIDQAHLMNTQAQNALLKTLEEPSKETVIILVSEYPYVLLPTILSRVFRIKFLLVPSREIENGLKDVSIAKMSFGRPGKAIEYLQTPEKKKNAEKEEKELRAMLKKEISFRFSLIKKVTEEEREEEFLNCWLKVMQEEMLEKLRKKKETGALRLALKEVEEAIFLYSKTNTNTRLLLEKIAIKI